MAAVRGPDGGDPIRMPGGGEPVVDCCADFPALDGRVAGPGVACNQEHDALFPADRALQAVVDCAPRLVEVAPVEVEDPVGLNGTGTEPLVPASVERGSVQRDRPLHLRRTGCRARGRRLALLLRLLR